MQYWIFKSEPTVFGILDLAKSKNQTTHWEGVRNYQARNMLRDAIKVGDQVFFYHSNTNPPGIVGTMEVVRSGYPDYSAWDSASKYYDPKSSPTKPLWYMVDVRLVTKFKNVISLDVLKNSSQLKNMLILRPGNRLSITPVSEAEWKIITDLSKS